MQKRIGLYVLCSTLLCIGAYWLEYTEGSYSDEILLVFLMVSLAGIFALFVFPSFKNQRLVEKHHSILLKNLKINADNQPASISSVDKIDKLTHLFEQCRQLVVSLKENHVEVDVHSDFKDNDLVEALLDLKSQTRLLSEREAERHWVSDSTSKFFDLLKSRNQSEDEFYNAILTMLVKLVEANQGGLFMLNEDENGAKNLELVACYAYNRKKFIERKIDIGQGLVGQAYLEGSTIVLKKVPEDYVKITSGLGEHLPKFLVIVPFKLNDRTECILELASFTEIPEYKIQFLEKVGESIASSVISSKTNQRMKHLLAEAESNAEELHAQEEEMRQNMEELSATQEEMARKERELVRMLEQSEEQKLDLNKKILEIEKLTSANETYKKDVIEILNSIPAKIFLKDKDGTMILCNNEVARAYKLTINELIGTHDRDHFDAVQAKKFREQELDVMATGLKTYVQEERLNGELRYFRTTKMPFYIHHLGQTGLLGYQFDVTESISANVQER